MNERERLIRAAAEEPDDDLPRLVLADWLEENVGGMMGWAFRQQEQAMTRVVIESALAARLAALTGGAELCTEDGKVVGRFIASVVPPEWEPASPGITEEELERRKKSAGRRYSTAEVLAHLEKL